MAKEAVKLTAGVTEKVADFAVKACFEDLPEQVVHESKRLFLDSMGCALAGWSVDKGRLAAGLAEKLGGDAQSTIFGGKKVSIPNAAFANGELINALDFDSTCTEGHIVPYVMPASLALAESAKASGRDLILAFAVAQEVATRVGRSLSPMLELVTAENGTISYHPSPVYGYSSCTIGGAVGAAKIMGLDLEKMLYAIGLAGRITPVPSQMKWWETIPAPMDKYCSAGWVSQAEVTSVLLAHAGYTGDTTVLDGESGFWKFFGSKKWEPKNILEELGEIWYFPSATNYKIFPCCGIVHIGLELFTSIIDENRFKPDEIDEVKVFMPEWFSSQPIFKNREIKTHLEAQFSCPYVYSVVAYGLKPDARWQDPATFRRKDILSFMSKVSLHPSKSWVETMPVTGDNREFAVGRGYPTIVEVKSKGHLFRKEGMVARGRGFPESVRLTDAELVDKFRSNASRILTEGRIEELAKAILELEQIGDVSQLMMLTAM